MSKTLGRMISDAYSYKTFVAGLKRRSRTYPDFYKCKRKTDTFRSGHYLDEVFYSSLVPFTYEGRKYLRHHVESALLDEATKEEHVYLKLIESCELTLHSNAIPFIINGILYDDEVK